MVDVGGGGALSRCAESVICARAEGRLVDASMDLEKWVALSRRHQPLLDARYGRRNVSLQESDTRSTRDGSGGSGAKSLSSIFAARSARSMVDVEDQVAVDALQDRLPKLRKIVEREGNAAEQLTFVAAVSKHNAHGKVQTRVLVVTDHAVYNISANGTKFKRRIPLRAITHVTASESAGQFVLHVPSEYDYLFASPSRGFAPLEDAPVSGPPLAGIINAVQRAWMLHSAYGQEQLPVRTYNDATSLVALVKTKRAGGDADDDDEY